MRAKGKYYIFFILTFIHLSDAKKRSKETSKGIAITISLKGSRGNNKHLDEDFIKVI